MAAHDDTVDEAAITLRFVRHDSAADPDETSCYVLCDRAAKLWQLIDATRQNVARLREGLASGWDIWPELAHEERWLAKLEEARRQL